MDLGDGVRLRQVQQVVIALEVPVPVGKARAAEVGLVQAELLDHGPHRTVENEDAFRRGLLQRRYTYFRHSLRTRFRVDLRSPGGIAPSPRRASG